ncbi:sensor domain-containing diguanylate cyclase [Mycobacterium yunnanensis]|uniref:Sensor domain-containing diguanylate cyclase n=1 Tax=Mycobacterium yunnanensis TaxID=368477 RepID=A0A9X3C1Z3_9MYCO|nr:sensor domain-containing diguanylate cyclase [Mycobacterium yunnanensis]MCV7420591.1 sensor domain-containing diguanylate cyclase [Mycobacterium yunnanensis]
MQSSTDVDLPVIPDLTADLPVLKALLSISSAVSGASFFDEVLEVIAEQALAALEASSLTISRWEPGNGVLRALVNVGDLASGQQRWPQDECYPVADDPTVTDLLQRGRSYANAVDDENSPSRCRDLLRAWGRESEVAAPVMCGNAMWGEIWASGTDGRRFDHGDAQLLQAIAAHTAVAIGRSELLSTVWQYAFRDPLTDIANRRAIDQRFLEIDWGTATVVALVCDLDGFKHFNDHAGHPAGDELLRHVAAVLQGQAEAVDGALAARLGGDEFCVLLPDSTLAAAEGFADEAARTMRDALQPTVSLCWGAAAAGPHTASGRDLLEAADAALLESKRQGPARFSTTAYTRPVVGGLDRRGLGPDAQRGTDRLAAVMVQLMRENAPMSDVDALEMLAMQVQAAIGLAGWAISVVTDDGKAVYTPRKMDSVKTPESGLTVLTDLGLYGAELADYPATARALATGSTFLAALDLDGSEPTETALLADLGYRAVLGVGIHAPSHRYLLEIYSHDGYRHLEPISPLIEVLSTYCVNRPRTPDGGTSSVKGEAR